ncbi:MAG TPA: prenyltransferase/squalene oxidase repeat-containing protein [Anaerolineae bacterium]|nr:prenyltransferase/squalene oxidase repeat-containing protein [Anaerolineae bacterium]
MEEWKRLLRDDPTAWLLEEDDPSVRYFTLVSLLDRREDDPDVRAAREAINLSDQVRAILDAQRPAGYWDRDKRPYHGVSKHLMVLEHLGYQGHDVRVHRAVEYLFANAQMDDGALSSDKFEGGRSSVIPCFTANAVRLLHWFGYGEDPRTVKALDYLLRTQRDDGGWLCFERVKKTHACFWATAKALRALEALPADDQTAYVTEAVQRAVSLFLDNGLYRHHSEFGKVSTRWFQFARPLFASTDVLEVLELVALFVAPDDERIEEGLNLVLEKQHERGRWPTEREIPVRKTFPIPFETVGQPSKWVTLGALNTLRQLYS